MAAELPPSEPVEAPSEPEPAPHSEPEADSEPEVAPKPVELEPLCQSKCDQVAQKCTKAATDTCRAGCDQWTRTPEACKTTAELALECARDAQDLLCAPVVPESCAKQFIQVTTCQKDPDSFTPAPVEKKEEGLPAGWVKVKDEQAGFTLVMPEGATLDERGGRTWRATGPDGVAYSARVLVPLNKKPDAKAWVKLASEKLEPCNLKTRLHGLIEKPDFMVMRYDSECKGSGERHGGLYVLPKAFVITAIEGPQSDDAETFLFGLASL